ncbi:hypothetical protein TNCV_1861771 [Trichonephila clavipes]|nr:hypothetical protein TNCV_1861771 [Trichonephila clavipes]
MCTAIHKIIPKALECNGMTLTVFAKDVLISEDLLIYSFSSPPPIHHIRTSRLAKVLIAPDVYIRLYEVRSLMCTAIHKIIPKALECNERTLKVFAEE